MQMDQEVGGDPIIIRHCPDIRQTSHVCDPYYLNTLHVGPPYRHLVENTSHLYVQ